MGSMVSHGQRLSAAFVAAVTLLVAIGIHISAEFVSLGWAELAPAMLHRHLYLLVAGIIASLTCAELGGCFSSPFERRNRIRRLAEGLPFRGRGPLLPASCFGAQVVLFMTSQAAEGMPIAGGAYAAGLLLAVVLCALSAALVGILPDCLDSLLGERYVLRSLDYDGDGRRELPSHRGSRLDIPLAITYRAVLGNRPPPVFTAAR